MSGTRTGGIKAAATNRAKYGADFYRSIGRTGGVVSSTGGFASDVIGEDGLSGRERARIAGSIGGQKSKRTKMVATDPTGDDTIDQ